MIRTATLQDMPSLMAMVKRFHYAANLKEYSTKEVPTTFEACKPFWEEFVAQCIERADLICLVAEEGVFKIGYLTAFLHRAYWNPNVVNAAEATIWVEPEFQGRGTGSGLVQSFERWAREKDALTASIGSSQSMSPKAMGALARKEGFQLKEKIYSKRLK